MSGVSAVLLSYGGNTIIPPGPIPIEYTMTNVDSILLVVPTVPDSSALGAYISYAGSSSPNPSAYVTITDLGVDPMTAPVISFTNYSDVDWGSNGFLWEEAWEVPTSSYPFNASIMFDNLVASYGTQTTFTGSVKFKWAAYGVPSPSTFLAQITPYTGGAIERQAVNDPQLQNVGGTAGTPIQIQGNVYETITDLVYTRIDYTYTVSTKSLLLSIYEDTVPL